MRHSFNILNSLLLLAVATFPLYIARANDVISASGVGLSNRVEQTQSITCLDKIWATNWIMNRFGGTASSNINGSVSLMTSEGQFELDNAQELVFGQFMNIRSISATCRQIEDSRRGVSRLSILGTLQSDELETASVLITYEPGEGIRVFDTIVEKLE